MKNGWRFKNMEKMAMESVRTGKCMECKKSLGEESCGFLENSPKIFCSKKCLTIFQNYFFIDKYKEKV